LFHQKTGGIKMKKIISFCLLMLLFYSISYAQYPKLGLHGNGGFPNPQLAKYDMIMNTYMTGSWAQQLKNYNPNMKCLNWGNAYDAVEHGIGIRQLEQWVVSTKPTVLTDSVGTDTITDIYVDDASIFFNPFYFGNDTLRQFCILQKGDSAEFPCRVLHVYPSQHKVTISRDPLFIRTHSAGDTVRGCASCWPNIATMNITSVCPYGYWNGDTTWTDHWINNIITYLADTANAAIDGMLIDQLGARVSDQGSNFGYKFDLNYDGVEENTSYVDSLWRAGAWSILERLHTVFPNKILLTEHETWAYNYAQGRTFNGWPWLQTDGGVFGQSGGWVASMKLYSAWNNVAHYSLIHGGTSLADSNNYNYMRFSLASCLMGDGYFAFDAGDEAPALWWFDEYSVDTSGIATNNYTCKGWLGIPSGNAYPVSSDSLVWRRDFAHGTALVSYLPHNDSLWIDLDSNYARIIGVTDTAHNTGDILNGIWMRGIDSPGRGHGEILFKKNIITNCTTLLSDDSHVQIEVYPNPSSDKITIELQGVTDFQNTKFVLYDGIGREMKRMKINKSLTILEQNFPSGMYFYQVKNNKQFISSGKLIVQ